MSKKLNAKFLEESEQSYWHALDQLSKSQLCAHFPLELGCEESAILGHAVYYSAVLALFGLQSHHIAYVIQASIS